MRRNNPPPHVGERARPLFAAHSCQPYTLRPCTGTWRTIGYRPPVRIFRSPAPSDCPNRIWLNFLNGKVLTRGSCCHMTRNGLCRLLGASKPAPLPGYHPATRTSPRPRLSQGGACLLGDDPVRVRRAGRQRGRVFGVMASGCEGGKATDGSAVKTPRSCVWSRRSAGKQGMSGRFWSLCTDQ
jgi:hypothetical protein